MHALAGAATANVGPYPHTVPLHVLLFEHALPCPPPQGGQSRPIGSVVDEPRTVYAFSSRWRAAKWCLHAFNQAGPAMRSIEWHAFDGTGGKTAKAVRTLSVRTEDALSDGVFDSTLPVTSFDEVKAWAVAQE